MAISRRQLLKGLGLGLSSLSFSAEAFSEPALESIRYNDWESIRRQFDLDPNYIHLAGMLLASHPKPVREAIIRHQRGLDKNPVLYLNNSFDSETRSVAGRYLNASPSNIALTDSTTMGVGIVYTSLRINSSQENSVDPSRSSGHTNCNKIFKRKNRRIFAKNLSFFK